MIRNAFVSFVALVSLTAASSSAIAQKAVSHGASVTVTATIDAIDSTSRLISLKDKDGNYSTVYAPPEVKRFSELKVGQTVTFTYYESLVFAIQAPGTKPPAPADAAVVRSEGPKPGGTISQQVTATVTINAIDAKVPSVTVTTDTGRRMSMKVDDPKNLAGVKVGDKVQVTYTQALAISVK